MPDPTGAGASRTLWNHLLAAGLVDEIHLVVGGVVLGGGTPAFSEGTTAQRKLLDIRKFDDSDNLVVRYAVYKDWRLPGPGAASAPGTHTTHRLGAPQGRRVP